MAPAGAASLRLACPNGHDVTLSADSAGIVACAYAYSQLSFRPGGAACGRAYHQLSAYIAAHADHRPIRAATD